MTDQSEFKINVTASADGNTMTVSVRGDVDAANAYAISAIVTVTHELVRVQRVVVDLSGVDFMDSSGISELIECRNGLHSVGVDFEVVGARDGTLRVLEVAGVLSLLSSSHIEVHSRAS